VGKSAIRKYLAPLLNATSLGPDDFGGDWPTLYNVLDRSAVAVVECCTIPGTLARKAQRRGAYVVEVAVDDETRRSRLAKRGEGEAAIGHLMSEGRQLWFETRTNLDMVVDADAAPQAIASEIAAAYNGRARDRGTLEPRSPNA
jgi:hypothetical protein